MCFADLCYLNVAWDDEDILEIMTTKDIRPEPMSVRSARAVFRDRDVMWFQDRVVMLAGD